MLKPRKFEQSDLPVFKDWVAKDPDHSHLDAEALVKELYTETYVFEDDKGEAVMFLRISRALRLDVQVDNDLPLRNAKVLTEVSKWLRGQAKEAGFRQMLFQSVSRPLIKFCCKRLGFVPSVNELVTNL